MEKLLRTGEKIIPKPLYKFGQPFYHYILAFIGALIYGFPGYRATVIAVTGTKGKSSTTEIISAIFEEAGYKTAVSNTIRFKIGDETKENLFKMSMPGRFFIQQFLRRAVSTKCDYVIMEITSQGVIQHRNKFIKLSALVFTNLSPEHIESHGSYENYVDAKVSICKGLRADGTVIVNGDDKESPKFLACPAKEKIKYHLSEAEPYTILGEGIDFTWGDRKVHSPLSGIFNLYNILAAIHTARAYGISDEIIIRAIEKFTGIKGRVQKIEAGQSFSVIVDYAHTPDSLQKLYELYKKQRIIAVFGCTGGGRDHWKRKEMGRIADEYAGEIILTDDDSYDEDPRKICEEISEGITKHEPTVLIDRRQAIREAFRRAQPGDVVLITGKGTDPYLMGPNGSKIPWSDEKVSTEELKSLSQNTSR